VVLWQNMERASGSSKPPELLSTHPSDATRIRQIEERLPRDFPIYQQARARGRAPRCS
jgi:predicted Zn-dependent protease